MRSKLLLLLAVGRRVLHVDAGFAEVGLEELEELVDVVPTPLVEDLGEEVVEVTAVDATLDLFDLLVAERLEDVLAERLGVALLDGVRGRHSDLLHGALVEVDLHRIDLRQGGVGRVL